MKRQLNEQDKRMLAENKRAAKTKEAEKVYFEQGYQAGFVPNGINLKPNRAKHNNEAAWLRGYNQGKRECEEWELKKRVQPSRSGFKQMKDILTEVLKQ